MYAVCNACYITVLNKHIIIMIIVMIYRNNNCSSVNMFFTLQAPLGAKTILMVPWISLRVLDKDLNLRGTRLSCTFRPIATGG